MSEYSTLIVSGTFILFLSIFLFGMAKGEEGINTKENLQDYCIVALVIFTCILQDIMTIINTVQKLLA
jgi:hypothetical protein